MNSSPLVSGEWLAQRLDDEQVRVVEIQYEPDIDEYSEGHIPGAVSWFWKDLLWHEKNREFPTPTEMAERLGSWGISPETTIVFYSGRNQYAMYAYWVTRSMNGHRDVRVLDGAQKRWALDGHPLSTDIPHYHRSTTYPSGTSATIPAGYSETMCSRDSGETGGC